jgi:hypothetical protein
MNLARHTPFLRIALLVLAALPVVALAQTSQAEQDAAVAAETRRRQAIRREAAQAIEDEEKITEAALPRFDLDFPGGTPADLIAAIEKASGQTLNVIIPAEYAQLPLPSLRLKNVNVPRLFKAFGEATQKTVRSGNFSVETTVNFITQDERVSPSSIWYFHVRGFAPNVVATRFYSLAPYLRADITVDDITTAIRTGWELRGVKAPPILKFHQETQLLIAVGEPEELAVIVDVLDVLTKTIAVRETAAAKH